MKFKAIATPDRGDFRSVGCKSQTVSELHGLHGRVRKVAVPSEYNKVEYFSNVKPDLFKDVVNKFMSHESMNMSKPEGEHAAHDGMEGMDA